MLHCKARCHFYWSSKFQMKGLWDNGSGIISGDVERELLCSRWSLCQGHQLQPALSVGLGKIHSQSSMAAAPAPGRTEPLRLGQERVIWHHSHGLGFYLGKDTAKSTSETVSASKPHKPHQSQIQSLLN